LRVQFSVTAGEATTTSIHRTCQLHTGEKNQLAMEDSMIASCPGMIKCGQRELTTMRTCTGEATAVLRCHGGTCIMSATGTLWESSVVTFHR